MDDGALLGKEVCRECQRPEVWVVALAVVWTTEQGGDAEAGGGRSPHRRRGSGTAVSTTSGARRRVEGGKGAEGGEPCG